MSLQTYTTLILPNHQVKKGGAQKKTFSHKLFHEALELVAHKSLATVEFVEFPTLLPN